MRYEVKESSGGVMTEKSFSFALRIVKQYQHLSKKKSDTGLYSTYHKNKTFGHLYLVSAIVKRTKKSHY